MKTLTSREPADLRSALIASKKGGTARSALIHTRDGVQTMCHGFQKTSEILSLIKSDHSYIMVEDGDTITYDDGTS